MGLLDTSSGGGTLASSLGGELLTRGLASGGFTGGLKLMRKEKDGSAKSVERKEGGGRIFKRENGTDLSLHAQVHRKHQDNMSILTCLVRAMVAKSFVEVFDGIDFRNYGMKAAVGFPLLSRCSCWKSCELARLGKREDQIWRRKN